MTHSQELSTTHPVQHWYQRFSWMCSTVAPVFLLLVRLYWGWQMAQTGWGKIQHIPKVADFFTSLGIPFPYANAVFVSWLELVGGILLALGLGSRFVALLLACDMVVAYLTAGRDNLLAILSSPDKFTGDAAFTFLFASLIVLFFGPGWISLDGLLSKLRRPV